MAAFDVSFLSIYIKLHNITYFIVIILIFCGIILFAVKRIISMESQTNVFCQVKYSIILTYL